MNKATELKVVSKVVYELYKLCNKHLAQEIYPSVCVKLV